MHCDRCERMNTCSTFSSIVLTLRLLSSLSAGLRTNSGRQRAPWRQARRCVDSHRFSERQQLRGFCLWKKKDITFQELPAVEPLGERQTG